MAKMSKINTNFFSSDFDMRYIILGVFGVKESIFELKIEFQRLHSGPEMAKMSKKLIPASIALILTCDMSFSGFSGSRNSFLNSKLNFSDCTVLY